MNCLNCNCETLNPKFCSRSCAAKYTNKTPKRKRTNKCIGCNKLILSNRTRCILCHKEHQDNRIKCADNHTLEDVIYLQHHKATAFALVRSRARTKAKKLGLIKCQNCGYDKHVEIAHKKAIASFDKSTLVSIINSPDNLMALCPNCHWEYDNLK